MRSSSRGPILGEDALASKATKLSNWGRWGENDQLGTLNLIDATARQRAADSLQSGEAYSLALPIDENGPTGPIPGRGLPRHLMTATGAEEPSGINLGGTARFTDDAIEMPLQCTTQWDGLAHVFYDDRLYNGAAAATVSEAGATTNGIHAAADRLVGRGVLLDFAGTSEPGRGQLITAADLDRLCGQQNVSIHPGDILLVRTGSMALYDATGSWSTFRKHQSGLAFDCLDWLHEHQVAAVACDNATVELAGVWADYFVPFHMVAIRDMGLWLGEYWRLEELAHACRAERRWTFFLSAPPLPIVGAVGSPVNPLAVL